MEYRGYVVRSTLERTRYISVIFSIKVLTILYYFQIFNIVI